MTIYLIINILQIFFLKFSVTGSNNQNLQIAARPIMQKGRLLRRPFLYVRLYNLLNTHFCFYKRHYIKAFV
jgi:hypothetical protein